MVVIDEQHKFGVSQRARLTTREPAPDVLDVIITSLFNVPVYQGYGRAIGGQQYVPPGFDLVLGMKDVNLALKAGEQANVPLPFASVLRDALVDCGNPGVDLVHAVLCLLDLCVGGVNLRCVIGLQSVR